MVLVKYNDNWADEMDINGFAVMEAEEWETKRAAIEAIDKRFYTSFGTNEDQDYPNGTDFLRHVKAQHISDDEALTIIKLFGKRYGHTNFLHIRDEE